MSLMKGVNYFTAYPEKPEEMSITEFYNNQEIFITGGSGFIGKALIEKLLRSFSNFKKMFILMRPKKDKSADKRLQELLDNVIFQRAREEQPEAFNKIYAIAGDCKELGIGIKNSEDLKQIENVTIIFHAAANVKFDNTLKDSVLVNLRGTHELLKIAETMTKLKAFVHVSTLYSNVNYAHIYEKIMPSVADWRTTIKLAEKFDSETLDTFFKKYSSNHPNTYTFAKSLSEHMLNDYRNKLPVLIYRVAQVTNSFDEPLRGWIDNLNGPAALFPAASLGIMRVGYFSPLTKLNMVPCDVTVHGLIISAYAIVTKPHFMNNSGETVEVVNNCCSNENLVPLQEILDYGREESKENPLEKAIWAAGGSLTTCWVWFLMRFIFTQLTLSILLDGILSLTNKKPFLMRLQRRIYFAIKIFHRFTIIDFIVENDKYKNLSSLITEQDKDKLDLKVNFRFGREYVAVCCEGYKKFIFNESAKASKRTILRHKVLTVLNYTLQFILVICVLWIIRNLIPITV